MNINEKINELPKDIRDYIHNLETSSPADLIQEIANLKENQKAFLGKFNSITNFRAITFFLLRRYSRHDKACLMSQKYIGGKDCDCGYTKALIELRKIIEA